jgi:hypothetical protein
MGSAGEVALLAWPLDPAKLYNERLIVRGKEKAVHSQESNGLLLIGREKKDGSLLTGIEREKREPELHGKKLSSRVRQLITSIM